MKPEIPPDYYQRVTVINDCTLYLGDCRKIIPKLAKHHAVITDPPYGLGKRMQGSSMTKHKGEKAIADMLEWDRSPITRDDIDMLLAAGDEAIIWGGNYFEVPPHRMFLVWRKSGMQNKTFSEAEYAFCTMNAPARLMNLQPEAMRIKGKKYHPTQKPLELMKWCVSLLPEAQTVLDPYMGSGTTGVACVKLGRHFTGVEQREDFFNAAIERINEAYKQSDLFY